MSKRFSRLPTSFTPHLERYVFACHYCRRKRVLDVGCKDGYGSAIMSLFANHITLADIEKRWLAIAELNNTFLCGVDMVVSDFEKGFPAGTWDVAVAFEIIEHVENPDFLIKNIAEHLEKGGVLVFSVPHMKESPGHKVLFDEKKIRDVISKYLEIKEFYKQDSYGISKKPMSGYPAITYVGVAQKI